MSEREERLHFDESLNEGYKKPSPWRPRNSRLTDDDILELMNGILDGDDPDDVLELAVQALARSGHEGTRAELRELASLWVKFIKSITCDEQNGPLLC